MASPWRSWLWSVGVAVGLSISVALLGVAATRETDTDYFENVALLRQLHEVDARSEAQVLRALTGIDVNYDSLAASLADTTRLSSLIDARVATQPHTQVWRLRAALGTLNSLENEKTEAVEQFKSANAVVRNSLAFLPTARADLVAAYRAPAGAQAAAVAHANDAFIAVLTRTRAGPLVDERDLETALALVARDRAALPGQDATRADVFLAHARTALDAQGRVDSLVRDIMQLGTSARIDGIGELLGAEQKRHSGERLALHNFLLVFATLALALFILAALRLSRARAALGKANLQLQGANEHLESRVAQRTSELYDANLIVRNSSTILYRIAATSGLSLTYVSPNIVRYGLDPAVLVGNRNWVVEVVAPEHLEAAIASMLELVRGDVSENTIEYRLPDALGASRWVEDRRQLVRDAQGRVLEIEGIVFDVTARKQAQLALKQSEEFTRAILDSISVEVAVLDSRGVITAVNEPWRRFARLNALEAGSAVAPADVGSDYLAVASRPNPSDGEPAGAAACEGIRAVLEGRLERFDLEYPCHSPEVERWFRMSVTPLGAASNGVVVAHEDITERNRSEAALRASEALLERTGRIGGIGGWKYDLATRAIEWTAQTARIHDVDAQTRPTLEQAIAFYTPESRAIVEDAMRRTLETGDGYDLELQVVTATGRAIWVRTVSEIESVDGVPTRLTGTFQDITARRDAEASAERSTRLLSNAIGAIDDAFVLFGPDQRLVFSNEEYRELYGPLASLVVPGVTYDDLNLISRTSGIFKTATDDQPATFFAQPPVEGMEPHVQFRRLADGRVLRATNKAMPEGHVVGILTDVTELLRASELAEQALLAKGQFLANISHEIRTPMNAILGVLALLQRTGLDDRQRDYVARTDGAARALLGVLNAVLDFSKIESGALRLDAHSFELEPMLRELSLIVSANVGEKALDLRFDIDPALPRAFVGDSMRLQQVLVNLMGNAVKFTQDGFVELAIHVRERRESAVSVEFVVRDTGIGIAPENHARIFSGFTQAEASITRRFGGTGLGLAISHRLVGLMGGVLGVESAVGVGSSFAFRIDLETPAAAVPQAPASAEERPLHVLLIADDLRASESSARMGRSLGWDVEVALDGDAALRGHQAAHPAAGFDLVIIDGPTSGAIHRERHERVDERAFPDRPPVVLLGSLLERERTWTRIASDARSGESYLVKPFTAAMLRSAALDLLNGPAAPTHPGAIAAGSPQRLADLRILVVEDNATNQLVARELLEAEGATIAIAADGEQALRALPRGTVDFDVVLMDLQMPVMDGFTAARRIREELGHHGLPIIAMTANASGDDRLACLAAGMVDHIGKPFDLNALVDLLRRHTGRSAIDATARTSVANLSPPVLAAAADAGVDLRAALARLNGNMALYAQLLAAFIGQAPATIAGLHEFARHGDVAGARASLHALKGLAGTLGIEPIAAAAAAAEASCDGAWEGWMAGEAILGCCDALASARLGLKRLQAACVGDSLQAEAVVEPLTAGAVLVRLERIAQLLRQSDMAALDLVSSLRRQSGAALGQELAALDDQVGQLQFGPATELCDALIARLQA